MTSRKTSSSRSTSSRAASGARLLLCAAAVVVVMAAGCARKTPDAAAAAPPRRGYVRLETLAARHPLQEQVRQLREAEGRLRRIAAGSGGGPLRLRALPPPGGAAANARPGLDAALARRRAEERDRVRRVAGRELRAFADIGARRVERLNEQRRAQLLAELAAEYAGRIEAGRDAAQGRTRDRLAALALERTVYQARLAVLRAQLDADAPIPLPALEAVVLDAEIAKLDADLKARGVSQRARLERIRRAELAKLLAVNARIAVVKADADREIAALTGRIRQELEDEVRRRLALGREESDSGPAMEAQRRALAVELAAEADTADAALRAGVGPDAGLPPLDLQAVFGSAGGVTGGGVDAKGAADRLAERRRALERRILAVVADAVRDAARNRNVDVVLVGGAAPGARADAGAARADMTREFGRWIQPGATLPGLLEGTGS